MRLIVPSDMPEIARWHAVRKITFRADLMPSTGLIVEGVAACFVYFTNEGIAIVECLITNSEASPFQTARALKKMMPALYHWCRHKKMKRVFATTRFEKVSRAWESHGGENIGEFYLLRKDLV